ncbi:MAG: glycine cleavage system protein GcvH [Oscillospiraceae bacterium]|nr:glycine cleavage system protein GcvH [Oscillospiraceae bacterium]
MSMIPENLRYTKTHEWVKEEDGLSVVGLTDFAQSELGDIVFVNLPEVGDEVVAGESFADVESVKAVAEVISPVSGVVAEINEELMDKPEMINEAPYDAWFIRISDVTDTENLLDAAEYSDFCEEE